MRSPRINQQLIYYANPDEKTTDEWGNEVMDYGDPEPLWISLSAEKGSVYNRVFGMELDYTREMVTTDTECPINENSHLWIGISTEKKFNYAVTRVARTRNHVRYAIKEFTNEEN